MQWQSLTRSVLGLAVAAAALSGASAHAAQVTLDVSGIFSNSTLSDAGNETRQLSFISGTHITGVSWNVTLFADSPSWLSEIAVNVRTDNDEGFELTPGWADGNPGTASYSGSTNLFGSGDDFFIGASGLLKFEFFEHFDDYLGSWDGIWDSGSSITITYVPEPASFGLAGLALLGAGLASRRRRNA